MVQYSVDFRKLGKQHPENTLKWDSGTREADEKILATENESPIFQQVKNRLPLDTVGDAY